MKAIILSAGQGSRLGEFTKNSPKCLLPLCGRTLIDWQLAALEQAGIDSVVVVTGFGADQVADAILPSRYNGMQIRVVYNRDYATADNLISCWTARHEMDGDFLLINGDSLFESGIVTRLTTGAREPISLAVATKQIYDADDMKVRTENGSVCQVAKDIAAGQITGEAIGVSYYRGDGPQMLRKTLEAFAQRPDGRKLWYLSAINHLAQQDRVGAVSIDGYGWAEVDFPADIDIAEHIILGRIEPDLAASTAPPATERPVVSTAG